MTRKEAIKWFKESPAMHKDNVPFQMAIKALENENALIDRVLEIIRNHTVSGYGNMGEVVNIHIRDAQGMIDEISALKGGENNEPEKTSSRRQQASRITT